MKIGPIRLFESQPDYGSALARVQQALYESEGNEELLQERLAELELGLEDIGWMRWGLYAAEREFSRDGLYKVMRLARLHYLKNPLINRAVSVQAFYVWGAGVSIKAANEHIDGVVQAFLDDPKNQAELTSHQARVMKETDLCTTGNLFFVFFVNQSTGRVRVRTIDVDEVHEIITNPDDAREPWLYKRVWNAMDFDIDAGLQQPESKQGYYPDWRYRPDHQPKEVNGTPVFWDRPVYHVKTGGLPHMRFGIPEIYCAIDWARAAKEDLEDYATMRRAHSRFAWNLTVKGGRQGIAAAKNKLGTTLADSTSLNVETNPPPLTGSTFIGTSGAQMTPMNVRNSGVNPEDGRRLWLMVAAGTGLPETFFGDANVGNHATASTLDRPTELRMQDRQALWVHVFTAILNYVVLQAVKAPSGPLSSYGSIKVDPDDDVEYVEWSEDPDADVAEGEDRPPIDGSVVVEFPDILEHDVAARVSAIVQAATLGNKNGDLVGTLDDETVSKLLLQALGVEDVEGALAELFPDDQEPDEQRLPWHPLKLRQMLKLDRDLGIAPDVIAQKLGYPAGSAQRPALPAGPGGEPGPGLEDEPAAA